MFSSFSSIVFIENSLLLDIFCVCFRFESSPFHRPRLRPHLRPHRLHLFVWSYFFFVVLCFFFVFLMFFFFFSNSRGYCKRHRIMEEGCFFFFAFSFEKLIMRSKMNIKEKQRPSANLSIRASYAMISHSFSLRRADMKSLTTQSAKIMRMTHSVSDSSHPLPTVDSSRSPFRTNVLAKTSADDIQIILQ